jgi:hypothetical protein
MKHHHHPAAAHLHHAAAGLTGVKPGLPSHLASIAIIFAVWVLLTLGFQALKGAGRSRAQRYY